VRLVDVVDVEDDFAAARDVGGVIDVEGTREVEGVAKK
jgi:hypothetical protein